jgi:UTP-glucose-1-phosphate uridylyltransferase
MLLIYLTLVLTLTLLNKKLKICKIALSFKRHYDIIKRSEYMQACLDIRSEPKIMNACVHDIIKRSEYIQACLNIRLESKIMHACVHDIIKRSEYMQACLDIRLESKIMHACVHDIIKVKLVYESFLQLSF